MQFFAPRSFMLLWLVPVVIALYWLAHALWKKRMATLICERTLVPKLLPGYRASEFVTRALLMALIILLSVLALARPQWGEEKKQIQRKGV
ncbi:MAG TPA: hypothetical protein PLY30_03065, partial [Candidatus Omnitrophota bacterium]|nr:hypothetical protein [Candidatus Omnitrophota bacterium]